VKPITRRPAVLTAALGVCIALLAGASQSASAGGGTSSAASTPAPAPRRVIEKTSKIAPGLILKKYVDKKLPRHTFELIADLSTPLTLDVTLGAKSLPARATVSDMAKRAGALAAINGDFTNPHVGRPIHPYLQDGQFLQTVQQLGAVFSVSANEKTVTLGRPSLAVTATDAADSRVWTIDPWNHGPPAPGQIAGFSPIGGTQEFPPDHACSVRLLPTENYVFSTGADGGLDQTFTVDVAACQEEAMTRNGGVVLSAPPATDEATQLLSLAPGTPMVVHWTLGRPGILDAVGGTPILVQDGQVVVTPACSSSLCRSNPRTGIGVRADGKIILVVVDGRRKRWSVGPTLFGFARIMKDLGAVQALNLDGGGSTTMVVNGELVNKPSDGFERHISNAVLVLPGPDPGES
jgi:exopolysaccharide biosynthesis protein